MSDSDPTGDHGWENGWADHELRQRLRLARLTFAEKLQWLEEAHKLVMRLQESRDAARDASTDPPRPAR